MSHILQLSPCDDILWLIGKSVSKRRKELKRIAREHQANINYWICRSSDEFIVNWVKNHNFNQRTAGERMFDRTDLINHTLPNRHRLHDEIEGTDLARDKGNRLWGINRNGLQGGDCDPYIRIQRAIQYGRSGLRIKGRSR